MNMLQELWVHPLSQDPSTAPAHKAHSLGHSLHRSQAALETPRNEGKEYNLHQQCLNHLKKDA